MALPTLTSKDTLVQAISRCAKGMCFLEFLSFICRNVVIESQMVWIGRDIKDHLIPTHLPWTRTPSDQVAQSPYQAVKLDRTYKEPSSFIQTGFTQKTGG